VHIYPLEQFSNRVRSYDSESGVSLHSLLRPLEIALLVWVGLLAVLVYITWHLKRNAASDAAQNSITSPTQEEVAGALMVFAVITALAFWLAYVDGQAYASSLKQGYAYSPWRFGSFSLQNAPVCITSIEGKQVPSSPQMLLG
jgi:hypothetical protein